MNRPLPTAYSNLDTARQQHGARADQYVSLLWRTDPLAEAVMEAFAPLPEGEWQAMLSLALDRGIDAVPQAPVALRDLFAQLDRVPFWVDPQQCNLGGATFLRCRRIRPASGWHLSSPRMAWGPSWGSL